MSIWISLLLLAAGPVMVGLFDMSGDDEAEEEELLPEEATTTFLPGTEQPAVEEPQTPEEPARLTTADVQAELDVARDVDAEAAGINTLRGTDVDEVMLGDEGVSNWFDASGGDDTVTGNTLNDTLIGGDGSDEILGGAGDDALFGGFQNGTRADDGDADTLDGGAGDDLLFLGDDDVATGGEGADIFTAVREATGTVSILDFDPAEDTIAIEADDPDAMEIASQTVTDEGLEITLNSGLVLTLAGLDAEISPDLIHFVSVTDQDEEDETTTTVFTTA